MTTHGYIAYISSFGKAITSSTMHLQIFIGFRTLFWELAAALPQRWQVAAIFHVRFNLKYTGNNLTKLQHKWIEIKKHNQLAA